MFLPKCLSCYNDINNIPFSTWLLHNTTIGIQIRDSFWNMISKQIIQQYDIPESLKKYEASITSNNNLELNYDKKNTKLKEIIDILYKEKIIFNEINTFESDLEDVFLDLVNKNG